MKHRKYIDKALSSYGNFTLKRRNLSPFSWGYGIKWSLRGYMTWELEVSQKVLATKEQSMICEQSIEKYQKSGCILQTRTTPLSIEHGYPANRLSSFLLCCFLRWPSGVKCLGDWIVAHALHLHEDRKKVREYHCPTCSICLKLLCLCTSGSRSSRWQIVSISGFQFSMYGCTKQHKQAFLFTYFNNRITV